jgi:L-aspartate oxidase
MLEGLVFGIRTVNAAREIMEQYKNTGCDFPLEGATTAPAAENSEEEIGTARAKLQELMWHYAGLVRDGGGLGLALSTLDVLQTTFGRPLARRDAIELANMITVARLIAQAALTREESRGAHFRSDFPQTDDAHWQKHIVLRQQHEELSITAVPAG